MNLEIMLPSDEPVRLLSAVLEELDYSKLTATYSYIGRSGYSPRLLFKVVLYVCARGIYSSREIERACREDVNFMYLLEEYAAPDHNTIARFRSQHLPDAAEELFGYTYLRRKKQFLQDRSRCYFYAYERRPYEKRSVEAGI